MTTNYNPASLNFGDVSVGSSLQLSVAITGTSGTTITGPSSPFSMSPSSVTLDSSGKATVTVKFSPTATGGASGTLTSSDATPVTCGLSGIGTATDKFESLADTTATSTNPTGVPTAKGLKYYQIVVPDFSEGPSTGPSFANVVNADGTSAGAVPTLNNANSFLRLGTPPDPTSDWSQSPFQNSVNLARLVGDPWVISAAENMTLNNSSITTPTKTDSSTASSLVPSKAAASAGTASATSAVTWSSNFSDGSGNPSITSDDANTFGALYDVANDGSLFGNAFNSNQDASYFPGFADDTRQRGTIAQSQATGANLTCPATTNVSNQQFDNVPQNRQAETLKLLSKGGWWDHSDGNRVTTTSGDKIEVIQGNYKLVVLGRQSVPNPPQNDQADVTRYRENLTSLAANAFITDVSGGHFQEQYPSPTPCIKTIEYVQDSEGEWTLYQDNGLGNLVTKLKGRTVDLFQGVSRETYVGSSSTTALWDKGGASPNTTLSSTDPGYNAAVTTKDTRLDPMIASYTWAQSVYSQTGSEGKPVGYGAASPNASSPSTTAGPQPTAVSANSVNGPIKVGNGDVVSTTWAKRVASYVGSKGYEVPTVYAETHAGTITSNTYASSITAYTSTSGDNQTTTNSDSGKVSSVTTANTIESTSTAGATTVFSHIDNAGLGTVINMTKAGSINNLAAAFHMLDLSIGLKTSVAASFMRDIYLGGKFSFTLAAATEIFVGRKLSVRIGPSWVYNSSEDMEMSETKTSIAAMVLLGV